ncbi:MAG: hypothetical protein FJ147_14280 [Deltaproteobacteria bacterium]|nr:hypothetical protein [Deltaproteobacteria bacterium]
MEIDRLCMGCMEDKGDSHMCSACGFDERKPGSVVALPLRTMLNQQYLVGRVLGSPGGFGITYLGWDINLKTPVAIKEYKPRGLVERAPDRLTVVPQSPEDEAQFHIGLQLFLNEARLVANLAQFNHPNIVRVRALFEANGAGYMVMDYYRGQDLYERVKQSGKLQPKTARWVMMSILDGLRTVHEHGVLHRDIKPQNIYITDRKQPVLLDFGAARDGSNGQSRALTAISTPGYAPYEQEIGGKQGPWTDIDACGATLYYLLSGKVPPAASERKNHDELVPLDHLVPDIPSGMSEAIMQALAVESEQRPQDVQTFQTLLMRDGEIATSLATATLPPTVASIVVTCPSCNVTNSVPAGRTLANTACANCSAPLSVSTTTAPVSTNTATQHVGLYPLFFSMMTRKGQSIAIGSAVLLLLLGGGLWAKQSYEKSLAEEQNRRLAVEQELKQKALEAEKHAEEAKRLVAERERQQKEEIERRKDEDTRRLAEEKSRQEVEAKRLAEENQRLKDSLQASSRQQPAVRAAPLDPEVAEMERQRRVAEARARAEDATRRAETARQRREEEALQRDIARKERAIAEAEAKLRSQTPASPAALPNKSEDGTGALDSVTDIACKFLGNCDARFRSNNRR